MIYNLNVACAGICVRIILLIVYLSESFLVSSRVPKLGYMYPQGYILIRGTLCVT